jgi:hypothetical protein
MNAIGYGKYYYRLDKGIIRDGWRIGLYIGSERFE